MKSAKDFMYEYGCFTSFFSNFEIMMEVAIWKLEGTAAKANCITINKMTAGQKKRKLESLLQKNNMVKEIDALNKVFDSVDRNGWIHGCVLNPKGDFSILTKLRVVINGSSISVSNDQIDFDNSPFDAFYNAFGEFEEALKLSKIECNDYLKKIQES